jgi:hypothetical protein
MPKQSNLGGSGDSDEKGEADRASSDDPSFCFLLRRGFRGGMSYPSHNRPVDTHLLCNKRILIWAVWAIGKEIKTYLWQLGFPSSHLTWRILQVTHPVRTLGPQCLFLAATAVSVSSIGALQFAADSRNIVNDQLVSSFYQPGRAISG